MSVNTYAVLQGGVIVNVVSADSGFADRLALLQLPEAAGIGWTQDGESFDPPPAPPDPVE
jgi:hypothetical protein